MRKADNLLPSYAVMKSGNLNFLEPSGPVTGLLYLFLQQNFGASAVQSLFTKPSNFSFSSSSHTTVMSVFKFTVDHLLLFPDITIYKSFISNTLQYNYPRQYIYTHILGLVISSVTTFVLSKAGDNEAGGL